MMKHSLRIITLAILFLATPFASSAFTDSGRVVRVLAIGNSFSCDAVEEHLYELTKAAGRKIIIGNAFIGGCTLSMHNDNATHNKASYNYSKRTADGHYTLMKGVTLETALLDEDWDIITVQQQSGLSGIYSSWEKDLPDLLNYIKSTVSSYVSFMIHQTWAYDESFMHNDFQRYSCNQDNMYHAIVSSVASASRLARIRKIIPSGTAIQNARTTPLRDNITRDGYHLSRTVGRYIAACTWFESIFHQCVIGNSYCPDGMSFRNKSYAQRAAHMAVRYPTRNIKIK